MEVLRRNYNDIKSWYIKIYKAWDKLYFSLSHKMFLGKLVSSELLCVDSLSGIATEAHDPGESGSEKQIADLVSKALWAVTSK